MACAFYALDRLQLRARNPGLLAVAFFGMSSMPFVKTWVVPGTEQLVYLNQQPLEVFSGYIQEGIDSKEAGGILLGHVLGKHLELLKQPSLLFRAVASGFFSSACLNFIIAWQ
jgi:hypothetical protein